MHILLQNFAPEYSDKQLEVDEPMDDMRDDTGPSTSGGCRDNDMEVETSLHTPNSQLDASLTMHDYCGITPSFSNIRHQMTQTPYSVEDASTQTDVDLWTSETCIQTDQSCFTFHTDASTQVDKPVFTYENIQHSDEKVLFYTGIPNAATFQALFNEIKDDAEEQTGRKQKPQSRDASADVLQPQTSIRGESGRPRSLRLVDEFLFNSNDENTSRALIGRLGGQIPDFNKYLWNNF